MTLLEGLPPFIADQLGYLLNHGSRLVKVEKAWSGNKFLSGSLDRFTLLIPYCLDYIKWDVVYNTEFPMAAPDIIFGLQDDGFHSFLSCKHEGENFTQVDSSLCEWNNKDQTRLLSLILNLRNIYILYQKNLVEQVADDRLKFEICTVLSRDGIEMQMISDDEKPVEVKFAVPLLDIDINKLLVESPWRHQQKIYLQAVYPVTTKKPSAHTAPCLKLIPTAGLESLFPVDKAKLLPWLDGMCMAEYLPRLEESLQRQIVEAVSSIDVRRCFIEALVPLFGNPLEADPVFCRKASFLASSGILIVLVHFCIPALFPKQQPSLILQSTQHFNSRGTPLKSTVLEDYPWSPRWEPVRMAEHIFDFLVDECVKFKRYCSESQLLTS